MSGFPSAEIIPLDLTKGHILMMKTVTIYTDGRVFRKSRTGRLGGNTRLWRAPARNLRRRARHDQQPHGIDRRHSRAGFKRAVHRGALLGLQICNRLPVKRLGEGWRARGWRKADKTPALNPDLFAVLLELAGRHELHYHWVKGHAENADNNRCDELARREIEKFK